MAYAGFWRRFWAIWIDIAVLLPISLLLWMGQGLPKELAPVFIFFCECTAVCYYVCCHARFGRTVGKWAMGIKVVRTDGNLIGWREAWLRSSVEIAFKLLFVVAAGATVLSIPDDVYYGADMVCRAEAWESCKPSWSKWLDVLINVWVWSEVLVMLTNRKRRALHDFIAGTVVIRLRRGALHLSKAEMASLRPKPVLGVAEIGSKTLERQLQRGRRENGHERLESVGGVL